VEPAAPGAKATWLELFYDLVYVYAFINVSVTTSAGLTPGALLRALLILALLWFAWTMSAAVTNTVRADQGIMPVLGFAGTAVIFVAALSIPYTLAERPLQHPGDYLFPACYLVVRALQVLGIWYVARREPHQPPRWLALVVPPFVSTALLVAAASVHHLGITGNAGFAIQVVLWLLAIAFAYGVSAVVGSRGLRLVSARHWAERYGQVILIALGESFISLGMGSRPPGGLPLTWPVVYGSLVGTVLIAGLAWAYFDMRAIAGLRALHTVQGGAQAALARDAYVFLHLPMIVGIIGFALGLKHVLAAIADPHTPNSRPLPDVDVYLLYGGALLYLAALVGFQLRVERRIDWFQVGGRLLMTALIPLALVLPGIAALGLLALTHTLATAVNHVRVANRRQHLRGAALEEERAVEAAETRARQGER
jgi:low temperature requirement protein LtrA